MLGYFCALVYVIISDMKDVMLKHHSCLKAIVSSSHQVHRQLIY